MAENRDDLHTVKIVGTEEEAAVVVGFLQANGMDAGFESLHSSEFPADVGPLTEVRIQVPAEQAADAIRLLADTEAATAEVGDFPPPNPPEV